MPLDTFRRPDTLPEPTSTPVPAGQPGWVDGAWTQISGWAGTLTIAVITAALSALTVYLLMRRPTKTDLSKRLMYAPLLLVNGAAVYGQVAFFYDEVAPDAWLTLGKVILAIVIALAIESVSIYVGWHAHDALLKKATNTAARLRRWSYLIAAGVAAINYAHFADSDGPLGINAASVAFGMLSLLSPWLWGLHTRREQRVQLLREGRVDEAGATFSGERIRSFPIRSYLARRWSIDHYVTDPRQAWEGYNAELRARWAVSTTDQPGWWLRINPAARVRQLTAALTEAQAINGRCMADIDDLRGRLTDTTQGLTAAHDELADVTARLDAVSNERANTAASLQALTDRANTDLQALTVEAEKAREELTARLTATHNEALRELTADYNEKLRKLTAERDEALRAQEKKLTAEFTAKLAEASTVNLNRYRNEHPKTAPGKTPKGSPPSGNKPTVSDETAVQMMLTAHRSPDHVWSQNSVRTLTGAGFTRIPKLIELWREAVLGEGCGEAPVSQRAVNQ